MIIKYRPGSFHLDLEIIQLTLLVRERFITIVGILLAIFLVFSRLVIRKKTQRSSRCEVFCIRIDSYLLPKIKSNIKIEG